MARIRFRDRKHPLSRRRPFRQPLPRILVICEGKVTEPEYFDSFRKEQKTQLVDVIIDDEGGVPKTLVARAAARKKASEREAKRLRDNNLKYDEVWCVFDVDQHPNLPDARQQARDNGIELAISNPCFELWLILHFCDQTAHIERSPASSLLRKHLPRYQKHVSFEDFRGGYFKAVSRAKTLAERCIWSGNLGGNPSTGVHLLTERIREFRRP